LRELYSIHFGGNLKVLYPVTLYSKIESLSWYSHIAHAYKRFYGRRLAVDVEALGLASKYGFVGVVRNHYTRLGSLIFSTTLDQDENTILHLAAIEECLPVISLGSDLNISLEIENSFGATPLLSACFYGKVRSVKLLLDLKANIEAKERRYEQSALCVACARLHRDIVDLLIKSGANVDVKDRDGYTPATLCQYTLARYYGQSTVTPQAPHQIIRMLHEAKQDNVKNNDTTNNSNSNRRLDDDED